MTVNTVAILSPGDMGSGVGHVLAESGLDVITCLQGRSERSRQLAERAGFRDVPSMETLVTQADLILSILVPSQAMDIAEQVADALRGTGANTYFADCNAISPQTTKAISSVISSAGGRYIDGGIIGSSPWRGTPRFYVSGEHATVMSELDGRGIIVRPIGDAIGKASGIKMCYAAMTKGTSTLHIALLTAAEALGLTDELKAEFAESQANLLNQMETRLSSIPPNAHRWIGEMEEIASTFEHVGVTPFFHKGAAEIYRVMSQTPFANETPETADKSRPTSETIKAAVEVIRSSVPAGD